jgi:hypothetical protein
MHAQLCCHEAEFESVNHNLDMSADICLSIHCINPCGVGIPHGNLGTASVANWAISI